MKGEHRFFSRFRTSSVCRFSVVSLFVLSLLLVGSAPLMAQKEITYDPYVSVLKRPAAASPYAAESRDTNRIFARILEQPLRPFAYGLGRTAQWVEEHRMQDKAIWFYDELTAHGIRPRIYTP